MQNHLIPAPFALYAHLDIQVNVLDNFNSIDFEHIYYNLFWSSIGYFLYQWAYKFITI